MSGSAVGWRKLVDGFPWFEGEGRFPLPAYSEFMPAPRIGMSVSGDLDSQLFRHDDPWGFRIPEIEEAHELRPGLASAAEQVMKQLVAFTRDPKSIYVAGPNGRNLEDNPFWSPDLAARIGALSRRTHVLLLPVALSKTQDDRGHQRWTLFGCSEQGPEQAFWQSLYREPESEMPARRAREAISALLSSAYGVATRTAEDLHRAGFRILPTRASGADVHERVTHWYFEPLPQWTRRFVIDDGESLERVRFLLTFRPFSRLPEPVRTAYLDGRIELIPTPLGALLWGMPVYRRAHRSYSMALQYPLLRLLSRHEGIGLRVPQLGWLHQPRPDGSPVEIGDEIVLDAYTRTHRWDRVMRDEDAVAASMSKHKVSTALFSTALDDLGLYHKPMARNCQIWTRDGDLVLNGPTASPDEIRRALDVVMGGGLFLYRFQFPPMRVGRHDVYWQRPLTAFWTPTDERTRWLDLGLDGYLTAYDCEGSERALFDLQRHEKLYPRLLARPVQVDALEHVHRAGDRYRNQTAINIVGVLDAAERWGKKLPRRFARQMLRISKERRRLGGWVEQVMASATSPEVATRLRRAIAHAVDRRDERWPAPITFDATATRAYEERYWTDLATLSRGKFVNKVNADVVHDEPTRKRTAHPRRDLQALGDYLIERHRDAIAVAGMDSAALVGALPFKWQTDFDYAAFDGWRRNQDGRELERNILVVIPGKNRGEAVVMGDHYDVAYMEDVYEKERGGDGARIGAQGADDNASATATLLQAAPIFLDLAKRGELARDVWLIHLTGEEFPSDCMGARVLPRTRRKNARAARRRARGRPVAHARRRGARDGHDRAQPRERARHLPNLAGTRCRFAARCVSRACGEHDLERARSRVERDRSTPRPCAWRPERRWAVDPRARAAPDRRRRSAPTGQPVELGLQHRRADLL